MRSVDAKPSRRPDAARPSELQHRLCRSRGDRPPSADRQGRRRPFVTQPPLSGESSRPVALGGEAQANEAQANEAPAKEA
jgi:hypothetical protein